MDLAEGAMDSPWIFAALFAFAALDAFFPIVPSESLVITAGVFAASGEPNLVGIILAGAGLGLLLFVALAALARAVLSRKGSAPA